MSLCKPFPDNNEGNKERIFQFGAVAWKWILYVNHRFSFLYEFSFLYRQFGSLFNRSYFTDKLKKDTRMILFTSLAFKLYFSDIIFSFKSSSHHNEDRILDHKIPSVLKMKNTLNWSATSSDSVLRLKMHSSTYNFLINSVKFRNWAAKLKTFCVKQKWSGLLKQFNGYSWGTIV